MAGYWRGSGGHDEPSEPDRPEQRLEQQADRGRAYGDFDPNKISDEALLSYFGFDSWDEWRRARQETDDERLGDEVLESADEPGQPLNVRLSSETSGLEGVSLEDLTPPQFRDRTDRPAEPEQRDDSGGRQDEIGTEADSGGEPREPSPAVVRWLTGHMTDRPAEQKQERQEQPSANRAGDAPAEADQGAERPRTWKTIAEEAGEVRSYHSYSALKRDIDSIEGTQLHHIVEQSQGDPKRSGFSVERINATDNIVRLPIPVHTDITADYNSNVPGLGIRVRDMLNEEPWDYQYEYGCQAVDEAISKHEGQHDDDQR